jgi:hypothetical protein
MVFPNTALINNSSQITGHLTVTNASANITQMTQGAFVGGAGTAGYGIGNEGFGIVGQGVPFHSGILWGPKKDLDYWTARAAGLVLEPERRAMKLFASECDEERFSLYCHLGTIAALGNMTKHLYIVRRYKTVVEVVDGKAVGGWCVVTRDRHVIPETDHVLTLKSLIEGEEYSFRATGNRVGYDLEEGKIQDPYRRSFIPILPGGKFAERDRVMEACEKAKEAQDATRWRMWLKYKAMEKHFMQKVEPPKQMSRAEFELQELRNRLLMGVGAEPQTAYAF